MWGLKIPLHKYFLAAVSHRHLLLIAQHLLQCPTHMHSHKMLLLTDSAEGKSLLPGQLVHIQSFASKYSLWLNSLGKMPVAGSSGKDKKSSTCWRLNVGWVFHCWSQSPLGQPWAGKSLGTSDYLKIVCWVWKVFPSRFREREHVSPGTGKLYDVWVCVCVREREKQKEGRKRGSIFWLLRVSFCLCLQQGSSFSDHWWDGQALITSFKWRHCQISLQTSAEMISTQGGLRELFPETMVMTLSFELERVNECLPPPHS